MVERTEYAARYGEVEIVNAPSGHDTVEAENERSA